MVDTKVPLLVEEFKKLYEKVRKKSPYRPFARKAAWTGAMRR